MLKYNLIKVETNDDYLITKCTTAAQTLAILRTINKFDHYKFKIYEFDPNKLNEHGNIESWITLHGDDMVKHLEAKVDANRPKQQYAYSLTHLYETVLEDDQIHCEHITIFNLRPNLEVAEFLKKIPSEEHYQYYLTEWDTHNLDAYDTPEISLMLEGDEALDYLVRWQDFDSILDTVEEEIDGIESTDTTHNIYKIVRKEDIEQLEGIVTPAQLKILYSFYRDIYIHDTHQSSKDYFNKGIDYSEYEYKLFDVWVTDYGKIWLHTEIGLINDENTLASVFGRTSRSILIGKRGACALHNARGTRKRFKVVKGYNACCYTPTN